MEKSISKICRSIPKIAVILKPLPSRGLKAVTAFLQVKSKRKDEQAMEQIYTIPVNEAFDACAKEGEIEAGAEQKKPDFSKDVISFISEKFEKNTQVRGKMTAVINVKSDQEDTAFYLRLNIIKGDKTYCLREDIMPISKQYPDYQPGTTVPLEFSFIEHAFALEKGDRLRLDISSSCWPTFVPHTNLKGDRYYHTSSKKANNTVVFENSSITLNTLP